MHALLGDLNYFEEKFDDSVKEYLDSIQFLRYMDADEMTTSQLIVLVRNTLKLGLAQERRNTYDSAFVSFSEITNKIIDFRSIKLKDLGLIEKTTLYDPEKTLSDKKPVHDDFRKNIRFVKSKEEQDNRNKYHEEFIPEKNLFEDSFTVDQWYENLTNRLTPRKENILIKLSTFEGIRSMYHALLAKFQIIEKSNLGGITLADLKRLLSEFNFIKKAIKQDENYLLISDFYKKIADILFYKNAIISYEKESKLHFYDNSLIKDEKFKEKIKICENTCEESRKSRKAKGYQSHCTSCEFYRKSFDTLIASAIDFNKIDIKLKSRNAEDKIKEIGCNYISLIVKTLENKAFISQRKNVYITFANIMSDMGDTLLGCASIKDEFSPDFFEKYFTFISDKDYEIAQKTFELEYGDFQLNKLDRVLMYYYLSAKLYKKANLNKEYAHQLVKILYFFRDYIAVDKQRKKEIAKIIDRIENIIIRKIIKGISAAYKNNLLSEIDDYKQVFAKPDENNFSIHNFSLNKTTISNDFDEANMLLLDLKTSCYTRKNAPFDDRKQIVELYKNNIVSPYSLNSSMYNRIIKLRHKAHINYKFFTDYYPETNTAEYITGIYDDFEFINNFDFIINSIKVLASKEKDEIDTFKEIRKKLSNQSKVNTLLNIKELKLLKSELSSTTIQTTDNKNIIAHIDNKLKLWQCYGNALFKEIIPYKKDEIAYRIYNQNAIEFLITDSIYCNFSVIKLINIFGQSFMFNHSTLAIVHEKLMEWSNIYKQYLLTFEIINSKCNEKKSNKGQTKKDILLENLEKVALEQSMIIIDEEFKMIKEKEWKENQKKSNRNLEKQNTKGQIETQESEEEKNAENIAEDEIKKWDGHGTIKISKITEKCRKFLNNNSMKGNDNGIILQMYNNSILEIENEYDKEEEETKQDGIFKRKKYIFGKIINISREITLKETDNKEKNNSDIFISKYDKIRLLSLILFWIRVKKIRETKSYLNHLIKLFNSEENINTSINKDLGKLIGKDNLHHISKLHQCGKAKKEYYSAIETHTEGGAYMNMISQMYFLNDDFNDKSFHFSVASERYRINTGYIKKQIERHKILMKKSGVFQHNNYIKTVYHE
jgi:hypothetical protein